MARRTEEELRTAFWAKVDMTGGESACWPWTGYTLPNGYGHAYDGTRVPRRAHRYAYELASGVSPGRLQVLHSCDNPVCCNPAHLRLGSHRDNMDDKLARERNARGERHGLHRVPDETVLEIKAWYAVGGWSQRDLAGAFGLSQPQVGNYVRGDQRSKP